MCPVLARRSVIFSALIFSALALGGPLTAYAEEGARIYFITPLDGETVTSPVTVRFGLEGMEVAPAGVDKPHTGHHHLLIDTEPPQGEDMHKPIPADDHHRHFGGGQTEAEIELAPGPHTLQLLLGDKNHAPHAQPVLSDKITIMVE